MDDVVFTVDASGDIVQVGCALLLISHSHYNIYPPPPVNGLDRINELRQGSDHIKFLGLPPPES